MLIQLTNACIALPEMVVLAMASVAILAELFFSKCCQDITYRVVQFTLIVAFALTFMLLGEPRTTAFNGLFVSDDVAVLLKLFIYLSSFFAYYYAKQYLQDKRIASGEFYILGLFSVLGMMVLTSAQSMLSIYLGLELMSLPIYAMIALRRECGIASEAAMKYFVMGAIASGILLFGASMLYGATGSIDLAEIANRAELVWHKQPLLISFSLVFLVVGVCFKLAAVPFHMWAPDVYHGAPSSTAIIISSAPKLAAFGMLYRLFIFALPAIFSQWQQLFMIVAVLSILIGNLLAVVQTNLKRLIAYSGISHMGYMLFGLVAGTPEGYGAALFYILVYSVMTVAAFGLILLMSRLGFEAELIEDLKGLNARSPWIAAMMLIVLFSMAGVPPMIGFISKLLVFKALVSAGYTALPLVGLLLAVIGAFYYIRIVKTMYFEQPILASSLVISPMSKVMFSANALSLIVLGLFPNLLVHLCMQAVS